MRYEKSCGGIVYRKHSGSTEILLIQSLSGGHWTFPKGHVEAGETETETAMREILEETGIEADIDTSFRETETYSPKEGVLKDVVYFLAEARTADLIPQASEVADIKWVALDKAGQELTYENDRRILNKAIRRL